jgi:hypothetical protein
LIFREETPVEVFKMRKLSILLCAVVILSCGCEANLLKQSTSADQTQPVEKQPNATPNQTSPTSSSQNPSTPKISPNQQNKEIKSSDLINEIYKLATEDTVRNGKPVRLGNWRKEVEKHWGKAEIEEIKGSAKYPSKNIIVQYDRGSAVMELDYRGKELQKIKISDIKKRFGEPYKVEDLMRGYALYYRYGECGDMIIIFDFLPLEIENDNTSMFQYRLSYTTLYEDFDYEESTP